MSTQQISGSWLCDYITLKDNNYIKCRLCESFYPIHRYTDHLRNHILYKHKESYRYARALYRTNFNWKQYFYTIQNNNAKCNLCNKIYLHYKTIMNPEIKVHLQVIHNVNQYTAKNLRQRLRSYISINFNLQSAHFSEIRCNVCNHIFQNSNSLNLMKHMRNIHQIDLCPRIKPMD